ncbi:MAG: DMT family transporter [Clostridia bacterium]|nr:DMT family transporter [Deltaproteobacteria bacterium]
MTPAVLGAVFALLTALTWSTASLFFTRSGKFYDPVPLSLMNCFIGIVLGGAVYLIFGGQFPRTATTTHIFVFALSGALGIGVADTLYFASINDIGAGRAAIIETAYAPLAVLAAYLYLHERLTVRDCVGLALVLSGVVVVAFEARHEGRTEVTRRRALRGVLFGLGATVLFVVAIIGIRDLLPLYDVQWIAFVRMSGGLVATAVICLLRPHWRAQIVGVMKPQTAWKFVIPAGVFGMFLSMQFWVAGFKYAKASIAAVLNQTSTLFIVILAAAFLGERLTLMRAAALFLGFAGALLVIL